MSQLNSEEEKKGANFSFLHLKFFSDPQRFGWCPPILGRAICFSQSTGSNTNLTQKHSQRNTQKQCLIWAHDGQSTWHVKLATTLSFLPKIVQSQNQSMYDWGEGLTQGEGVSRFFDFWWISFSTHSIMSVLLVLWQSTGTNWLIC